MLQNVFFRVILWNIKSVWIQKILLLCQSIIHANILINFYYICPFPQTVEDPLSRPLPENASSTLLPMFTSRTVQILKEVEAFPFPSLVADCGGVLGLFIGFNFLMVVEWIVWCTQIILTKFNTNKK